MNDQNTIAVLEPSEAAVKLSQGEYIVKPLTVRRMVKLAAKLKEVQGNPDRFKNPESPEFYQAICDMLVSAGDQMPAALALLTGDDNLAKLEDISLLDLSALVVAAAQVNRPMELMGNFQKAMGLFSKKPDQK